VRVAFGRVAVIAEWPKGFKERSRLAAAGRLGGAGVAAAKELLCLREGKRWRDWESETGGRHIICKSDLTPAVMTGGGGRDFSAVGCAKAHHPGFD
jgi:hypothetical protein